MAQVKHESSMAKGQGIWGERQGFWNVVSVRSPPLYPSTTVGFALGALTGRARWGRLDRGPEGALGDSLSPRAPFVDMAKVSSVLRKASWSCPSLDARANNSASSGETSNSRPCAQLSHVPTPASSR